MSQETKKYNVAISFAGEDREIARQIRDELKKFPLSVFFDEDENLLGEDLLVYLSNVYGKQSDSVLILISKHYAEKAWTRYERRHAFSTALQKQSPYVFPIRLDDTELEELPNSIVHLRIPPSTPELVAKAVARKLNAIPDSEQPHTAKSRKGSRRTFIISVLGVIGATALLPERFYLSKSAMIDREIAHRLLPIPDNLARAKRATLVPFKAHLVWSFFRLPSAEEVDKVFGFNVSPWPRFEIFKGISILTLCEQLSKLVPSRELNEIENIIVFLNKIDIEGKEKYFEKHMTEKGAAYIDDAAIKADSYYKQLVSYRPTWSGK